MGEFLFGLVCVLTIVTLVGHGIWVCLASLFGDSARPRSEGGRGLCPRCDTPFEFGSGECRECRYPAFGTPDLIRFAMLKSLHRRLNRALDEGLFDRAAFDRLVAPIFEEGRRLRTRLEAEELLEPQPASRLFDTGNDDEEDLDDEAEGSGEALPARPARPPSADRFTPFGAAPSLTAPSGEVPSGNAPTGASPAANLPGGDVPAETGTAARSEAPPPRPPRPLGSFVVVPSGASPTGGSPTDSGSGREMPSLSAPVGAAGSTPPVLGPPPALAPPLRRPALEPLPDPLGMPDPPPVPVSQPQPQPQPPPPVRLDDEPTDRPARVPAAAWSSFLEEKNIRWGELVGGLLVVGSSIALVLSFRAEIARQPWLQFMLLNGFTATFFLLGLYIHRHWNLAHTSRSLLTIAVLLVPLDFLATALIGRAETSNAVLRLAGEVGTVVLLWPLLSLATAVLVPNHRTAATWGVLAISLCQWLIRRIGAEPGAAISAPLLAALPTALYLATFAWIDFAHPTTTAATPAPVPPDPTRGAGEPAGPETSAAGLASSSSTPPANVPARATEPWAGAAVAGERSAGANPAPASRPSASPSLAADGDVQAPERQLVRLLGLVTFAFAMTLGLLFFRTPEPTALLRSLAPWVPLVALPTVAVGLTLRRRTESDDLAVQGTTLALCGALGAIAAFPLAWPLPLNLTAAALTTALAAGCGAVRCGLPRLHAVAALGLAVAFGIVAPLLRGAFPVPWDDPLRLDLAAWSAAFSRTEMGPLLTLPALLLGLTGGAFALRRQRVEAACYGGAAALVALAGIAWAAKEGWGRVDDHGATFVFAGYGLATLVAAWLLRRGEATAVAALLLAAAAVQGIGFRYRDTLAWDFPWTGAFLLHGGTLVALALLAGLLPQGSAADRHERRTQFVLPLAWMGQLGLTSAWLGLAVLHFKAPAETLLPYVVILVALGLLVPLVLRTRESLAPVAWSAFFLGLTATAAAFGWNPDLAGDTRLATQAGPVLGCVWALLSLARIAGATLVRRYLPVRGDMSRDDSTLSADDVVHAIVLSRIALAVGTAVLSKSLWELALTLPLDNRMFPAAYPTTYPQSWLEPLFLGPATVYAILVLLILHLRQAAGFRLWRHLLFGFTTWLVGCLLLGAGTTPSGHTLRFWTTAWFAGVVVYHIGRKRVRPTLKALGLGIESTARPAILWGGLGACATAVLFVGPSAWFRWLLAADNTYVVPLTGAEWAAWGVVACVLAGACFLRGRIFRRGGYALAGGALAVWGTSLLYLLAVPRVPTVFAWPRLSTMLQVATLTAGLTALAWLAVVVRWQRLRQVSLRVDVWLRLQIIAAAVLLLMFMVPTLLQLGFDPGRPWLRDAVGPIGWAAWLATTAALLVPPVLRREPLPLTRGVPLAWLAWGMVVLVLLATPLSATAVQATWICGTLLLGVALPWCGARFWPDQAVAGSVWTCVLVGFALTLVPALIVPAADRPLWYAALLFGAALAVIGLAVRNERREWLLPAAAALLFFVRNLADATWPLRYDPVLEAAITLCGLLLPCPLWVVLERRWVALDRPEPAVPLHRVLTWGATLGLWLFFSFHLLTQGPVPLWTIFPWAPFASLGAAAVALTACLWDRRARQWTFLGYLWGWTLTAACLCALELSSNRLASPTVVVFAASYVLATAFLWSRRRVWAAAGERLGIVPETLLGLGETRWFVPLSLVAVTCVQGLCAMGILGNLDWPLRFLMGKAALLQGVALFLLAEPHPTPVDRDQGGPFATWRALIRYFEPNERLELPTLFVAATGSVILAWAWVEPALPAADFHRWVVSLPAIGGLALLIGGVLVPRLPPQNRWAEAGRTITPLLGTAAAAILGSILVQEWIAFLTGRKLPLEIWVHAILVGTLLAATAACLIAALVPGRDPLGLDERERTRYVYAAELAAASIFVHFRTTCPELFEGFWRAWWPLVLMAVAFGGVGLSEVFRKRRAGTVLADPLENTGAFLPLLPILGMGLVPSAVNSVWTLLGAAGVYGVLAGLRNNPWWGTAAIVSVLASFWSFLHQTEGFAFAEHPQAWLIPPSLCLIVAARLNRDRLPPDQYRGLLYGGSLGTYLSSTAEIFIHGTAAAPWLPVVLLGWSVAGVLAGMYFRVRAFLFLGVGFTVLALLALIRHAAVDLQLTWIWSAVGILTGIAILILFGLFERKRELLLRRLEDLQSWDP